jgi:hypothetical protein
MIQGGNRSSTYPGPGYCVCLSKIVAWFGDDLDRGLSSIDYPTIDSCRTGGTKRPLENR